MKLQRAILLLLAALGFATFISSYIGLANIRSADALVRYDLAEKVVPQTSIDDASRRVHFLDHSWTRIWWLGALTAVFSLFAFSLTFRASQSTRPNPSLEPTPAAVGPQDKSDAAGGGSRGSA
jgi:hypothetical protein